MGVAYLLQSHNFKLYCYKCLFSLICNLNYYGISKNGGKQILDGFAFSFVVAIHIDFH